MGDKNEHQEQNIEQTSGQEPVAENGNPPDPDGSPAEQGAGGSEPSGKGFSNPLEALAAENGQLEEQVNELNDKLLRVAAEMENLRRRTQKDVADARSFSISGFARDLLGVSDNLRRAIESVAAEDQDHTGLKNLLEGVEMTERELHKTLEKNGVRKISPLNEKFDPHFHQAMFEVANPELPNNTVTEVVQDGYVIGERVLRPAMVGVAKGGPRAEKAEAPDSRQEVEGEST